MSDGVAESTAVGRGVIADVEQQVLKLVADRALPVPPYPAVALRVQKVLSQPSCGLRDVARLISADPALTADVLRSANSALLSRGEVVRDLTHAITRVGVQALTRLVLASSLSTHALAGGGLAPLRRAIWIECLSSAVLCQELARVRGLGVERGAFVAGLLHDFGKVVVLSRVEAILRARPAIAPQPLEAWAGLVERLHVTVGQALATRWDLPAPVRHIIALHHGQTTQGCADPALLEVVRTADEVVALLGGGAQLSSAALAAVPGLSPGEQEAMGRIIERIPPFLAAFEGSTPEQLERRTWVAPPPSTLAPGERPVHFGVTLTTGRTTREYTAVVIASNGLLLLGSEPVAENYLTDAVLLTEPLPFRIWAVPRLCHPRGNAHRVELQPFALGGEARIRWNELYARAGPARKTSAA